MLPLVPVLALLSALLGLVGPGASIASADAPVVASDGGTPTALASLTMRTGLAALRGTQTTRLTVTAHLVDPDGIPTRSFGVMDLVVPCPCIVVEAQTSAGAPYRATPQAVGLRYVPLHLASGTVQDGLWTGTALLGAGDAAVWRPTRIAAGDLVAPYVEGPFDWSPFVPVPPEMVAGAALTLRGSDWPVLGVTVPSTVVDVGTAYTVRGRATLSRSRVPVPGLRLVVEKAYCAPELRSPAVAVLRTGSIGTWSVRSSALAATWCAFWGRDSVGIPLLWAAGTHIHQRATLTVVRSAYRVPSGSAIVVSGAMRPAQGEDTWVYLQRYAGGTWRTEARVQHSATGRYAFRVVHSTSTRIYRVRVVGGAQYVGRTSTSFTLRWG